MRAKKCGRNVRDKKKVRVKCAGEICGRPVYIEGSTTRNVGEIPRASAIAMLWREADYVCGGNTGTRARWYRSRVRVWCHSRVRV